LTRHSLITSVWTLQLVKRKFRLVLGLVFAGLGAFLFIGSLIAGFALNEWRGMEEFGVFGILFCIGGTAMCFEKN
jgi:hypothetical protein